MLIKHLIFSFILFSLLSSSASAADWSISFEFPRTYTFKDASDGSSLEADGNPVGMLFYIQFPFFDIGAGAEQYDVAIDNSGNNKISLQLIDLFYVLPIPFVNMGLGGGYGYSQIKGDYADDYKKSTAFQYFVRIGIPIGNIVQVYWSYHILSSRIEYKDVDYLLEAGGTMTSLGLGFGF